MLGSDCELMFEKERGTSAAGSSVEECFGFGVGPNFEGPATSFLKLSTRGLLCAKENPSSSFCGMIGVESSCCAELSGRKAGCDQVGGAGLGGEFPPLKAGCWDN